MSQFYEIKTYKQYDRDVKLAVRRGLDIEKLLDVVRLLRQGEPLPEKCHNHLLTGDYKGYWECHISPDWLLLYEKDTEIRIISLYLQAPMPTSLGKGRKDKHFLSTFPLHTRKPYIRRDIRKEPRRIWYSHQQTHPRPLPVEGGEWIDKTVRCYALFSCSASVLITPLPHRRFSP